MQFHCTSCTNAKPLKANKVKKKFDVSGLDYIVLDGVIHYRCDKCGEEFYNFGNLEKINNAIADFVATKDGKLTGPEIRFLRKYLGFSSEMFAKEMLRITASVLSRIENGKQDQSNQIDQLVRTLALTKQPDRNYDLHDKLVNRHEIKDSVVLRLKDFAFVPMHP